MDERRRRLIAVREQLNAQRQELVQTIGSGQRVGNFAKRVLTSWTPWTSTSASKVIEEVRVTGWQVEIRLRIPLDEGPAVPKIHVYHRGHSLLPKSVSS